MVFWTAQLAECVEENAGKPNQVGCYSGVFCPSTAIHAKVSHRLQICHPDPSVPGFPVTLRSPTPACAAFSKESRMKPASATNLDRKSGVA
jgi:hypothetical protein